MPTIRTRSRQRRQTKPDATTTTFPIDSTTDWTAMLEEVRQLRAAITIYRRMVDELLNRRAA